MVFEIILAAVLIAFGLMTVYFIIDTGVSDQKLMGILLLGLLCIGGGVYVLLQALTLAVILKKLAGLVLILVGLFFIIGFPDIIDYQPSNFGRAGIFIGIVLMVIGIWLLFF